MTQTRGPGRHWAMLTVVGQDRPGIVARLSEILFQGGCNLGEASMARLGGLFTVMLMVETDQPEQIGRMLESAVRELDLRIHVDMVDGILHRHETPNVQVTVHGADRPGIVAQVTRSLADAGFNILDLHSDVGGTADRPVYVMIIDGHARQGAGELESVLEPLRQAGIQISVSPLDTLIG